jgi:hypothetical protein
MSKQRRKGEDAKRTQRTGQALDLPSTKVEVETPMASEVTTNPGPAQRQEAPVLVPHLHVQLWEQFKESLFGGLGRFMGRSLRFGTWFLGRFGMVNENPDRVAVFFYTEESRAAFNPSFVLHITFSRRELIVEWLVATSEGPGTCNSSEIVAVDDGKVVLFRLGNCISPTLVHADGLCIHILQQVFQIQGLSASALDTEGFRLMQAHNKPAESTQPSKHGKSERLDSGLEKVKAGIREMPSLHDKSAMGKSAMGTKNAGTTALSQGLEESRSRKRPVRRNQRYKKIDDALQEIADSRPRTQEAVFQSLDDRDVVLPAAEPFMSMRGWIAGFSRNKSAARAWLSKRWTELYLPPLPRGPKNPKKSL